MSRAPDLMAVCWKGSRAYSFQLKSKLVVLWWKGGHNSISDSQFLFDSGQILELIFEIKGELVVLQWKGGHNSISDSQSLLEQGLIFRAYFFS